MFLRIPQPAEKLGHQPRHPAGRRTDVVDAVGTDHAPEPARYRPGASTSPVIRISSRPRYDPVD